MTLDDVGRIFKHWRKFPPLRDLVALFMDFKPAPDDPDEQKYMTDEDFRRLMAMTDGRIPGLD